MSNRAQDGPLAAVIAVRGSAAVNANSLQRALKALSPRALFQEIPLGAPNTFGDIAMAVVLDGVEAAIISISEQLPEVHFICGLSDQHRPTAAQELTSHTGHIRVIVSGAPTSSAAVVESCIMLQLLTAAVCDTVQAISVLWCASDGLMSVDQFKTQVSTFLRDGKVPVDLWVRLTAHIDGDGHMSVGTKGLRHFIGREMQTTPTLQSWGTNKHIAFVRKQVETYIDDAWQGKPSPKPTTHGGPPIVTLTEFPAPLLIVDTSDNGWQKSVVCAACRQAPVDNLIGNGDLCNDCHKRSSSLSLRPIEVFNLRAKHDGIDYKSDERVRDPRDGNNSVDGFLAPTLEQAGQRLPTLVDYCLNRPWIGELEFAALRAHSADNILKEVKLRSPPSSRCHPTIYRMLLCIAGNVLTGPDAADWVRMQRPLALGRLHGGTPPTAFGAWGEAASRLLPQEVGLRLIIDALEGYTGTYLTCRIDALGWIRSDEVLEWIERRVPRAGITEQWGVVAAQTDHLSWDRIHKWLLLGRPLSLVAIHGLRQFFVRPGPRPEVEDSIRPNPRLSLKGCRDRSIVAAALKAQASAAPGSLPAENCNKLIARIDYLRIAKVETPPGPEV